MHQVHAHAAARLIDFAQAIVAVRTRLQAHHVIARAAAPAAAARHLGMPRRFHRFRIRGLHGNDIRRVVRIAAAHSSTIARKLAVVRIAAVAAGNETERVAHGLANTIPLIMLASAGIGHLDLAFVSLGVVRAELPAQCRSILLVSSPLRVEEGLVAIDTSARCVHHDHLVERKRVASDLQQFAAAFVKRQPRPDIETTIDDSGSGV